MNALDTLTYDQVLETVHTWPPAKRISLAQDLLKLLASEIETSRPKRNTLKKALGLLAIGQPAPPVWISGAGWRRDARRSTDDARLV